MKSYIEAELHDLIENIKATTDVRELSFEEAYLLLRQKIKEKQIPVEVYYDPERLDPKSLWILDVSEFQKPIKVVFEDEPHIADYIEGWWRVC
jgi:hypothetical protein